jgi:hypothetical protein
LVKDTRSITNELNVLQNKVESLEHQKSDLEKEADRKSQEQATLVEDQKN